MGQQEFDGWEQDLAPLATSAGFAARGILVGGNEPEFL
jgi:hypothetical protein